jgi:drug/metabolite transporter superfamily protein YnfA
VSRNLLAFAAAAFFEIAGCFAFWVWLRRGASPLVALLGAWSSPPRAQDLSRPVNHCLCSLTREATPWSDMTGHLLALTGVAVYASTNPDG